MSDRLKDLQRQRALAQEQLAWLDREIARETGVPTPVTPLPTGAQAKPDPRAVAQHPVTPSAEDIIAQYQSQARPVQSEVKRGCFLYFFAALGLVFLGVLALYFSRRP